MCFTGGLCTSQDILLGVEHPIITLPAIILYSLTLCFIMTIIILEEGKHGFYNLYFHSLNKLLAQHGQEI